VVGREVLLNVKARPARPRFRAGNFRQCVEAGVSPAAIAADTAAATGDILGFAMTVSPLILTG